MTRALIRNRTAPLALFLALAAGAAFAQTTAPTPATDPTKKHVTPAEVKYQAGGSPLA